MNEQFKLYRLLGSQLIDKGKWFLNKAILVNKKVWVGYTIFNKVKDITGCLAISLYDEKFHTTDIETWRTIIEYDWTNKKQWIEDTFDCDNFAGSFSAHVADIYGLNTAGRFTVELRDAKTDKHIGYHRAVIIIDSNLNCWLLETQTDKMVKIIKNEYPIIDNWKYVVQYISFN